MFTLFLCSLGDLNETRGIRPTQKQEISIPNGTNTSPCCFVFALKFWQKVHEHFVVLGGGCCDQRLVHKMSVSLYQISPHKTSLCKIFGQCSCGLDSVVAHPVVTKEGPQPQPSRPVKVALLYLCLRHSVVTGR